MAWGSPVSIGSGEISAKQADKPLFISGSLLAPEASNAKWTNWDATTWDQTQIDTATGYPAYYGCDGLAHAATKPTSGERYCDWWVPLTLSGEFDCLFAIFDVGVSSGGSDITVRLQIADNVQFTTNIINFFSDTYATATGVQRAIWLPNTGYSGSGFMRLQFELDAGQTFDTAPSVYECIVGKSYQMSKKGIRPWDPEPMTNNVVRHVSDSGVVSSYVKMAGGWQSSMEWHLDQTGGLYNLDDVDTLRNFWNDTNYGTESFVYVEDPSSAPEYARLCKCSNSVLSMPYSGPNERRFALDMQELPLFATWSP